MFVDFDKVFNKKPQSELIVPEAMVSYLSSKLPKGTKYILDRNGNCTIAGDGKTGSITIGGYIFKLTPEHKKVLGASCTIEDVEKYFYNLQKPIPLELKKHGYVLLNGEEFPIDRLTYNPYNPIKYESGSCFMMPQAFPPAFALKVGGNGYEKELLVSRVTNNSVHVAAFESSRDDPLIIRYLLDERKPSISLSISFNLSKAKTIEDIVKTTSIYNAYIDGAGLLCGHPLLGNLLEDDVNKYDEESIGFWKKVLELERILGVTFTPPQADVDFESICMVESLYQNLVYRLPIRENKKIESIDGDWEMKSEEDVKNSIGTPIMFEFEATNNIDLFGCQITLPTLIAIFDAAVQRYTRDGSKYKIFLDDVSEEKMRYISKMCFLTDQDMKMYRDSDHGKAISELHDAKTISEYLK